MEWITLWIMTLMAFVVVLFMCVVLGVVKIVGLLYTIEHDLHELRKIEEGKSY